MLFNELDVYAAKQRRKAVIRTSLIEIAALASGIALLTSQYGWKTGLGLGLLAYVAMPIKK